MIIATVDASIIVEILVHLFFFGVIALFTYAGIKAREESTIITIILFVVAAFFAFIIISIDLYQLGIFEFKVIDHK